jgi:hypothetical protein
VPLVATPMVMNLGGSVNPNGPEICAAVLLFASMLVLMRGSLGAGGPRRAVLACAAVAAFVLVAIRHLGPALLLIDLVALAVLAGPAAVRAAVRRRDLWAWPGGGAAAGLMVYGGWLLFAASPVGAGPGRATDLGPGDVLRGLVERRFTFYVTQIVGQFGYGETTMSPLAVLLWYVLVAAVVLPAVWRAGWRVRAAVALLVVAGFGMLVALELHFVPTAGWFAHGRYALPVLVGAVLIAAAADARPSLGAAARWWPTALVVATAPVHLYALVRVLSRYRHGIDASLAPFGGAWAPPVPAGLALVAVLTGVVMVALTTQSHDMGTDNRASTRTVSAN